MYILEHTAHRPSLPLPLLLLLSASSSCFISRGLIASKSFRGSNFLNYRFQLEHTYLAHGKSRRTITIIPPSRIIVQLQNSTSNYCCTVGVIDRRISEQHQWEPQHDWRPQQPDSSPAWPPAVVRPPPAFACVTVGRVPGPELKVPHLVPCSPPGGVLVESFLGIWVR